MHVVVRYRGVVNFTIRSNEAFLNEAMLDLNSYVFVDRAGVGLLFLDPELWQQLEDLVWLHLELASELIDSDFLHR
jgi:hypothetical protein